MRITLDLSEADVRYFRSCLKTVRKGTLALDESVVLKAAGDLMAQVAAAAAPDYVRERIEKLSVLVRMLEDQRWQLTGRDRARVLNVLAYFVDPDDLIPDRIPGLGYLDDAIMVELVLQELRHEIQAYQDFCEFRKSRPRDRVSEALEAKRVALQMRMRRRRRKERRTRTERASSWSRRRVFGIF
jgi:uncharacterized membrane protein YkvA (DUF1232 family)